MTDREQQLADTLEENNMLTNKIETLEAQVREMNRDIVSMQQEIDRYEQRIQAARDKGFPI
jgi:peptidoglycan hydrolase CwlO-like protein